MNVITDQRCTEYSRRGHPERPQRILKTVERLKSQTELPIQWLDPIAPGDEVILRAHSNEHLKNVTSPADDFDADTPAYPNIIDHARRGVGGALQALRLAREGKKAFSLLRPPGHHATRNQAMGFCFLNSIAIAALEAKASGVAKVAVYDFDVHHGNGTEAILLDQPGCAFFSIHQYPAYPGTGASHLRNCYNYPVPPGSTRETYR
ncbi:MAG: histone deacetylase, partial [Verrucomicrobiota bacterium]